MSEWDDDGAGWTPREWHWWVMLGLGLVLCGIGAWLLWGDRGAGAGGLWQTVAGAMVLWIGIDVVLVAGWTIRAHWWWRRRG